MERWQLNAGCLSAVLSVGLFAASIYWANVQLFIVSALFFALGDLFLIPGKVDGRPKR